MLMMPRSSMTPEITPNASSACSVATSAYIEPMTFA